MNLTDFVGKSKDKPSEQQIPDHPGTLPKHDEIVQAFKKAIHPQGGSLKRYRLISKKINESQTNLYEGNGRAHCISIINNTVAFRARKLFPAVIQDRKIRRILAALIRIRVPSVDKDQEDTFTSKIFGISREFGEQHIKLHEEREAQANER